MKIKEIFDKKLLYVLDPMIKEFDSKLILIFFPDKFTSLDEMTDNKYSSRFYYSIHFAKKKIDIFDMLKNKKTCCHIK